MLAIVIPYYNINFFESTLQSLANQTNKQFKVYIGDDASKENPKDLLSKYTDAFSFSYHRFDHNMGAISLTQQWERCIELSKSEEWLMILGDDDVLSVNVVEAFYESLLEINTKNVNVVRFASQIIDEEGKNVSDIYKHPKLEKASDSFWRKYTGETRSSLSEHIFKKEVYLKFKFKNYPLAWHSDDYAWIEFSNYKYLYSINFSLIYIRESNWSISGKRDNTEQKKQASLQFYNTLSNKHLSIFNKKQRLTIIAISEKEFFEHKRFFLFLEIFKWHLIKTDLLNLLKFIRRIYINA